MTHLSTSRRDWTREATLAISLLALIASAISAYVSADSARLTKASTLVARRPIIAQDKVLPYSPDFARFAFKNAGTSPALDVVIYGKSELWDERAGKGPDFDHYPKYQYQGVVSAGMSADQGINLPQLQQRDTDAIRTQTKLLYVHGLVCYRDMWNQPHWLKFCSKLGPQMEGYYSCMEHNSIDNSSHEEDPCLKQPAR